MENHTMAGKHFFRRGQLAEERGDKKFWQRPRSEYLAASVAYQHAADFFVKFGSTENAERCTEKASTALTLDRAEHN